MLTILASAYPAAGTVVRWREGDAGRPGSAEAVAEVLTYRDLGAFRVCQLRTSHRLISAAIVYEGDQLRIITARSGIRGVELALAEGAPMPADARVARLTVEHHRRVHP